MSHAPFDFILRSQTVCLPGGMAPAAIYVHGARISAVTAYQDVPPGADVRDTPHTILPGLVDTHVHINDPGRDTWEGFATATRAAASGGVTTVVDMPLNSIPATTTPEAIARKVQALEAGAFIDVGLCGGLVPENAHHVGDLFREGLCAFKCFLADSGVYEFSHVSGVELERGLRSLEKVDAPLFVHAELPPPLEAAAAALGTISPSDARRYATYLASRPKSAEDAAVELVLTTLRKTGGRGHIVHLSSADALRFLRAARDTGTPLDAETCPHYLTLAAEDIPDGATEFKCAPPIRERENQARLWAAIREGLLTQIVTDHSPATLDLKCSDSGDFMKAWGGISSLELGLSVLANTAPSYGVDLHTLVMRMSASTAALAGLGGRKGRIAVGCDADLALWDPSFEFEVVPTALQHRNPVTAYAGKRLRGRVVATYLRGQQIFRRDAAGPSFFGRHGAWLRR
jgi:allantoinase